MRSKTVPQLKKILTRWFNEYIRIRDSKDGYGICISCGKNIPVGANWQAGHFIPSTYSAVRYDEDNVNGQCKSCNHFKSGNLTEYEENLRKKIGDKRVEILKIKKHNKVKWHGFLLEALITEYKKKVKKLKATQH